MLDPESALFGFLVGIALCVTIKLGEVELADFWLWLSNIFGGDC